MTLGYRLAGFAFFSKNLWFYMGADHNRVNQLRFFLENLRFSQGEQRLTTDVVPRAICAKTSGFIRVPTTSVFAGPDIFQKPMVL
jgi:hypothetical protein